MDLRILITLFIVLFGLLLLIIALYVFFVRQEDKGKVNRKWTDPKFHD